MNTQTTDEEKKETARFLEMAGERGMSPYRRLSMYLYFNGLTVSQPFELTPPFEGIGQPKTEQRKRA